VSRERPPRSPVRSPSGDPAAICRVAQCGRRSYARGLCQTHHRQMKTTGRTRSIRPYRPRSGGTVRYAGLRLTPECARRLTAHAEAHDISRGAAIADILEDWHRHQRSQDGQVVSRGQSRPNGRRST